jgi:hypothetical protein
MMKEKIEGRNLDDVLNIDQRPTPFLYHCNRMLDVKGSKAIQSRG